MPKSTKNHTKSGLGANLKSSKTNDFGYQNQLLRPESDPAWLETPWVLFLAPTQVAQPLGRWYSSLFTRSGCNVDDCTQSSRPFPSGVLLVSFREWDPHISTTCSPAYGFTSDATIWTVDSLPLELQASPRVPSGHPPPQWHVCVSASLCQADIKVRFAVRSVSQVL